jgi:hypothetical protein
MNFADEIKKNHQNPDCCADSNKQHLIHLLAGYRAFVTNDEETRPYAPGSARQVSFEEGIKMAKADLAKLPEKFTIQEFKTYLKKSESFGDAYHFLTAKKVREANAPEEINEDEE